MNHIYRIVWNAALGACVAVAENAKGAGKTGSARSRIGVDAVSSTGFTLKPACRAALVLFATAALLTPQVHAANAADAAVSSGAGSVATSGNTTTINQASQRLAIDWSKLSTAAGEALVFNQPNAQAIALNRITGANPSEFLGSLTANGQVFILNPNGVLFGAGSQVNVGGLVASTLSMSNADFEAGHHVFANTGASGSVVNKGTLTATAGGYLALLAPEVRNEGVMVASLGTALLAAGNKVTLNLDNGSLLGYSIDQGAINALAENKQLIKADGGQVLLSAKALDSLTSATVNNTGIIEAKTIQNKAGRIMLIGDMEHGMVNIGGTLDASAPNGGDGGFIETSAAHFNILPGSRINTLAPHGKTGTWLLDPVSMTIAAGTGGAADTVYEDTLEVAGANVVIQATDSINVAGTFSNGDVEIASGLNLTIQTTGTSGSGIDLTGSTHGAALNFKTSGGGNVTMTTASASQAIKTSKVTVADAGSITLNSAGMLEISGTTLQTARGAITLTGAGTSLGDGVKINNATLNAGSGALTIIGSSSTGTGVLLGTGAIVTNAGNVSITGTAGGTASTGINIAGGAQVDSTGGNVTVNGTFNNPAAVDGQGVRIAGKVSAAGGTVAITGNTTVGSGGGYGVLIDTGADISAASGVAVTGTYQAPTTATGAGIQMQGGTVASAGTIALTGNLSATSASGAYGLNLTGGSISATGAGTVSLTGSGVPAPAPASAYDLNLAGTTLTSAGGQIKLSGDRVNIGSSVNASAGRVLVTPTTISRRITLGGADETTALNLSNSELNNITAGVLAIGGSAYTGVISIGDSGGAVNMVSTTSLSLITESDIGLGRINQSAGLTVANLHAEGSDVYLSNTSNQISQISARTAIGNIDVRSALALSVGTVDGTAGIISTSGGSVTLASGGVLTASTAAISGIGWLTASSVGGMKLDNAGNRFAFFGAIQNSGSGDIILRNSIGADFRDVVSNGGGRIDISNTGTVGLYSQISSSNANTGGTAATAAISVVATGRISAANSATQMITNSGGGSVYLQAGGSSIGSSTSSAVNISTAGAVTAVAAGASTQVNLALSGGATVENISAPGAVNVTTASGNLAVKTVSGSTVTLRAAAGAILDANGAVNNITATSLNATAANGITLGTNVTGLQTLTTTGAAGDIGITAANALNTSNVIVSTNAGAAQTVSLSSSSGITVDTAFGNAQDNFKLTATGGNLNVNAALTANKLTLSTAGTSAQTEAITATGLELLGSGSHTLNHASNAVTTLAGNTGNVDYAQAGALAIGTVNTAGLTTAGKVLVRTTGATSDLTVANAVSAGSTASDALVLAAGRNFINSSASATPLTTGSGGRYLVYSTDPTANTFGGMTSPGNAFNRSYAANGPADASMTSLTGNRFVYSVQPTLNVSGDNKTKIYGGADPALTYTVASGLVAGDTAATALAGALSAPTGAATTGTTYAITQGTLASALGYNVAYTNGTLNMSSMPAAGGGATAPQTTVNSVSSATGSDAFGSALQAVAGVGPGGGGAGGAVGAGDAAALAGAVAAAGDSAEE